MTNKKCYVKYHVDRDPQTGKFLVKGKDGKELPESALTDKELLDAKPVAGKKIRECRITHVMAEELNEIALRSGRMYVYDEEAQAALEEEPEKESDKKDEAAEKAEIWEKINAWKEDGTIEKTPQPNTGVVKLKAFVEETEAKLTKEED